MNVSLYKQMLKAQTKTIIGYSTGSAFYIVLVAAIYPSLADSKIINHYLQQLPSGFLKAFNITGMGNLLEFIAGEYYGLLFLLLGSIYCITAANQLLARPIDRGSMAYLLATPNSRQTIVFTQALVLLTGLAAIILTSAAAGFAADAWLVTNDALHQKRFLAINVSGFLLFFAISGYSFFFCAIANDEKRALSLSGGITVLFYSFDLIGKLTEKAEWLRYGSIFAAFEPGAIAQGQAEWLPSCLLLAIGVISYTAGIVTFSKRDLPL
ncbi:ABC transporter permease subunit [Geobacillus thermodenitrificans]|uniref:ABC transporter permease subunit n=1 Tax=Geobacillus thermodenitrificans TaxID=33940 RepID=UPI002E1E1D75|nr:ABC transporter permease subunit [Geobacillus thermodenitrificans]MED0661552.1 permease [Geobacillus thermodenitrificans]